MRRLILGVVAACAAVALTASGAPAKNGNGVMCVLHAKLTAKSETTGSTSTAKGHTQIKVRANGTIEFKTQIFNKNGETFVAGHIHQAPVAVPGDKCAPHQAERRGNPERGHDRRCPVRQPERLLRQLPHDGVPGRRNPRPTSLATRGEQGGGRGLAPFLPSEPSWLGGRGDRDAASRFLPQLHLHHVGRKLERLHNCHTTDLSRGYLGEHEVVVLQSPAKEVRG